MVATLLSYVVITLVSSIINRARILFVLPQQLSTLLCFIAIIAPAWTIALYSKRKRSSNNYMPIVPHIDCAAMVNGILLETRYDGEYLAANDAEKMQFDKNLHSNIFNPNLVSYATLGDRLASHERWGFNIASENYEKPCEICPEDEDIKQMFKSDESSLDEERTFDNKLENNENELDDSLSSKSCLDDKEISQMMFIYDESLVGEMSNFENEIENSLAMVISWGCKEVRMKIRQDESPSIKLRLLNMVMNYLYEEHSSLGKNCLGEKDNKRIFREAGFSSGEERIFRTELVIYKNETNITFFCKICLENKESWQMFWNDRCLHSFCYECTTNYISAKIQDSVHVFNCPSVNCKAMLNPNRCRLMLPINVLAKWDELRCTSLIRESSKIYCPFRDCSSMIVNESGEFVRKVKCVACKRSFCAECGVPWHVGLSCKWFNKLHRRKGRKDDKIVKNLAKVNNWQKCPRCNMYVEKIDGCIHMTCRCKYEFCYTCGSRWSSNHECMQMESN